jgi:hypothetical protein
MTTVLSPEIEGYLTESTDRNAQTNGLFYSGCTVPFSFVMERKRGCGEDCFMVNGWGTNILLLQLTPVLH